ncbi:MAG TPA: alpha/beta fold hydrolase [Nocardioides sp.]|nr:alpha/beta fold hydrolase [Nocardioides sp.]
MRSLSTYLSALVAGLLLTVGLSAAATAHADTTILPPLPTVPEGDIAGVNNWSCRPTATHPEPVVMVHGTFGDRRHLLEPMETALVAHHYCVFALDYGNRGTGDIPTSARELKAYVAKVLAATGASKVSMIGHSQGGMMPRYYIKFLGGARYVDDLVGIAPSNHGTRLVPSENPLAALVPGLICVACNQQAWGSTFLQHLNAGDETPGGVSYTQIESKNDEIVLPYTSAFLTPGPRTTNVTLQNLCPGLFTDHLLIPNNKVTIAVTLNALRHPGPAGKDFRPAC